jgi:hypothetical protein
MPDPITVTNLTQVGRIAAPDPNLPRVFVTYNADFSADADITLDFSVVNQQQVFGVPRGLFIDNGSNPAEVEVYVSGTDQFFSVPANAEGYFKIDAAILSTIRFTTVGGATDQVTITIYNYDVFPNVWYKFGAFNVDGPIIVKGVDATGVVPTANPVYTAGLDSAGHVHPIALDTSGRIYTVTDRGTYTNRSGAIAAGGVSQQLAAVNANRKRIFIQNPATAAGQGIAAAESIFINFTTAAGVNDGVSIELQPGQSMDITPPVTTEAINITAATIAHKFISKELS